MALAGGLVEDRGAQTHAVVGVREAHAVGTGDTHVVFVHDLEELPLALHALATDLAESGGDADHGLDALFPAVLRDAQDAGGGDGEHGGVHRVGDVQHRAVAGHAVDRLTLAVDRVEPAGVAELQHVVDDGVSHTRTRGGADDRYGVRVEQLRAVPLKKRFVLFPALKAEPGGRRRALVEEAAFLVGGEVAERELQHGACADQTGLIVDELQVVAETLLLIGEETVIHRHLGGTDQQRTCVQLLGGDMGARAQIVHIIGEGGLDAVGPGEKTVPVLTGDGEIGGMHVHDRVAVEHGVGGGPDITGQQDHIGLEGLDLLQHFAVELHPDFTVLERLVAIGVILADVDRHIGHAIGLRGCDGLGIRLIGENADDFEGAALRQLLHFFLELVGLPQRIAGAGAVAQDTQLAAGGVDDGFQHVRFLTL